MKDIKEILEELKNDLIYEFDTGNFYWITPKKGRSNQNAGTAKSNGYRHINYNGIRIPCTKVAWYFMTGEVPVSLIGFKDGNSSNYRWDNLVFTTKEELLAQYRRRGNEMLGSQFLTERPTKIIKRATFTNRQVKEAVEEFIKGKILVDGRYIRPEDITK